MILSGENIVKKQIVSYLINKGYQVQGCGIDLTLKEIKKWQSNGIIDFDNLNRKLPPTKTIQFSKDKIKLACGYYIFEFNEKVTLPLNMMAQIFVRSSLLRMGLALNSGLIDAGYTGPLGCIMEVLNPFGVVLYKNARLAQIAVHYMDQDVTKPYKGIYQDGLTFIK